MTFPTTIEAVDPAFLSGVLGRPVAAVSATPFAAPWTSTVARLDVAFVDGGTARLVAKVRRPERGHVSQFEQELHFYRHVAEGLSCVPRLRFGALGGDDFLLLLDHVDGAHLRDGFDRATTQRALDAIARVHGRSWGDAALRSGLRDKVVTAAQARELVAGVDAAWDDVVRRYPRHLASRPDLSGLVRGVERLAPIVLTHNDLHAENVLVTPERVVFVDWQNALWGAPAYDVANLVAGCARPDVQRDHGRALVDRYAAALRDAGGPALPGLAEDVATSTGLLFAWMMRYLAGASDAEAAGREMLLAHWERVCTGVATWLGADTASA